MSVFNVLSIIASIIPKEIIIKQLHDAITNYLAAPEDEKKAAELHVHSICHMLMLNEANEREGGTDKLQEKMDLMEKGYNLLTPNEQ